MSPVRYWMAVVSKDHVARGVSGGFMQVCHGRPGQLKRMQAGDRVIFYSPKQRFAADEPCQAFTAIGEARDVVVYQHRMSACFEPWRRNVDFFPCREAAIHPLIEKLQFIRDKTRWGYQFRFGFFEISESDFTFIASNMLYDETGQQSVPV